MGHNGYTLTQKQTDYKNPYTKVLGNQKDKVDRFKKTSKGASTELDLDNSEDGTGEKTLETKVAKEPAFYDGVESPEDRKKLAKLSKLRKYSGHPSNTANFRSMGVLTGLGAVGSRLYRRGRR